MFVCIEGEEWFVSFCVEVVVDIAQDGDSDELSSFGVAVVSGCDFSGGFESVGGGDSPDLYKVVEIWVFCVYGSDHSFSASDIVVDFVGHFIALYPFRLPLHRPFGAGED